MYEVRQMNESYANIINTWKYDAPYEMYSFDGDEDEFEQIMSGYYFAVIDSDELKGFLAMGPAAQKICDENISIFEDESFTDIALGMRPDLTGKGDGREFVEACIAGARDIFPEDEGIRLSVMKDNIRAIKLYDKMGFRSIFQDDTFMVMTLESG